MLTRPSIRMLIGVPLALVLLDQLTKYWVMTRMALHETIPVIPGWFSITSIRNPGAAFGLFASGGGTTRTWLLAAISLVAVLLLGAYFLHSRPADRMGRAAALLVMGGAIGNLIDRIRLGEVIDFLDAYVGTHHWPAFNVADSAITIGVTLFLAASLLDRKPSASEASAEPLPKDRKRA